MVDDVAVEVRVQLHPVEPRLLDRPVAPVLEQQVDRMPAGDEELERRYEEAQEAGEVLQNEEHLQRLRSGEERAAGQVRTGDVAMFPGHHPPRNCSARLASRLAGESRGDGLAGGARGRR